MHHPQHPEALTEDKLQGASGVNPESEGSLEGLPAAQPLDLSLRMHQGCESQAPHSGYHCSLASSRSREPDKWQMTLAGCVLVDDNECSSSSVKHLK